MWSREEIKIKAKDRLKLYYWPAFVVSLLIYIFTGARGGASISYSNRSGGNGGNSSGFHIPNEITLAFTMIFVTTILIILALAMLFKIFVGNVLEVGGRRFYMESREMNASAGVGKIGWGFSCGHYLNIVKIMFLRDLYNILWYLLLFVPGVYKYYEYCMIPYILSERPDMDSKSVFALTKEMMDGSRFDKFVLELSFLGWYLLGILACGIGTFFVHPYYDATEAELYGCFRKYYAQNGLHGYGHQTEQKENAWEWEDTRE